jgi:rhamnosyltransferase
MRRRSTSPISIVIPTLDAGRAFGTILHRIMGQARSPLEILVVDSGSQDATAHIVAQFPQARFVQIKEPPGPRAWNRAVEEARGEIVAFLAQDAIPVDSEWLGALTAPLEDPSLGAAYGRLKPAAGSDPLEVYRLERKYGSEPASRRARFGDPVSHRSLAFSIVNCALRRSVWRGIHFNHHLMLGADRSWARQVLLASCTITYVPEAAVERKVQSNLRQSYRKAMLTGWTDQYMGDDGGTMDEDPEGFVQSARWHLLKKFRWEQLPFLALEDIAQRYGYRLGRRLHRMAPSVRARLAPEVAEEQPRRELTEREQAA